MHTCIRSYTAGDDAPTDTVDLTPWKSDADPGTLDWFVVETLSSSETEEKLLNSEGGYTNGTYLMRRSKKWEEDDPQYLFSVVYKNTPTHHKVQYKDGYIAVNNKVMNNTTTDQPVSKLGDLIAMLNSMPKGWPVTLSAPASATNSTPEPKAAANVEPEVAAVEPEAAAVEPEAAAVEPEAAAVEPEAAAVEPEVAAVEPEAVAVEPEAAAVEPEAAAVEPEADSTEPEAATTEPEASSAEPEDGMATYSHMLHKPASVDSEPETTEDDAAIYQNDSVSSSKTPPAAEKQAYTWSQPDPLPEGAGADYSTQAMDSSAYTHLYDVFYTCMLKHGCFAHVSFELQLMFTYWSMVHPGYSFTTSCKLCAIDEREREREGYTACSIQTQSMP